MISFVVLIEFVLYIRAFLVWGSRCYCRRTFNRIYYSPFTAVFPPHASTNPEGLNISVQQRTSLFKLGVIWVDGHRSSEIKSQHSTWSHVVVCANCLHNRYSPITKKAPNEKKELLDCEPSNSLVQIIEIHVYIYIYCTENWCLCWKCRVKNG